MRAFDLGRTFDVVTCLFSAIGYLETPRDRERALGAFYRHLVPGGVALVEGWVRPLRWRGSAVDLDVFDDVDAKVVRVASARREGRHSSVEYHYLVAETGRPIRHFSEVERNPLVETREMLASFRRAGFRAQVLLRGPYLDRGLYIGRRPAPRGAARAPTSGSGSRSARSRPRR
jgi:SAM-dependent methyltransferase